MTYSLLYSIRSGTNAIDWSWQVEGKWTRSYQEFGLGQGWIYDGKLDKVAYEVLLNYFQLIDRKDEFPLEKIVSMSPAEIAEISGANPISRTIGDNRKASEIR